MVFNFFASDCLSTCTAEVGLCSLPSASPHQLSVLGEEKVVGVVGGAGGRMKWSDLLLRRPFGNWQFGK